MPVPTSIMEQGLEQSQQYMQSSRLSAVQTRQVDWNAARNSDTIKKVSPSSIPMNHGWMWLRQHGAKRSMRKYLALNCRRRPSLDPLESRYLLSGGIEVIEVHPAPALIIGIDLRQTPLPVYGFGSLAISSVSSGPGDWPMPGFHHDFSPLGELATPAPGSIPTPIPRWFHHGYHPFRNRKMLPYRHRTLKVWRRPALSHGDVPPGLASTGHALRVPGGTLEDSACSRDLSARPSDDALGSADASQADEVTSPRAPVAVQAQATPSARSHSPHPGI